MEVGRADGWAGRQTARLFRLYRWCRRFQTHVGRAKKCVYFGVAYRSITQTHDRARGRNISTPQIKQKLTKQNIIFFMCIFRDFQSC